MWQTAPMGIRDDARADTMGRILAAARAEIAREGGGGLSMRAVARDAGLVSSAVYRYFATREALITAMIVESYGRLADALERTDGTWAGLAGALRAWALAHPHEFQLLYGTPIPGFVAPPETIPAAARVAAPFLASGASTPVPGFDAPALVAQLAPMASQSGVDASGAAAVLAALAALVGLISLELAGHFVGTADPADHLYAAVVARQQVMFASHDRPGSAEGHLA